MTPNYKNVAVLQLILREIYQRLPINLSLKLKLRSFLSPLITELTTKPTIASVSKALVATVKNEFTLFSQDDERMIEKPIFNIISAIAKHTARFGASDTWICLPFLARGGSEMVALNMCKAFLESQNQRSIILFCTDKKKIGLALHLPEQVLLVVLDDYLPITCDYSVKQYLLKSLLFALRPKRLVNINSEVAWLLFISEGSRLKKWVELSACIFAFQFSSDGHTKIGYAASFLEKSIQHLTYLISDNKRFLCDASAEYDLDPGNLSRLKLLYQPSRVSIELPLKTLNSLVEDSRPKVLWAGRLDQEKRIDLLFDIARKCTFVDFYVYGTPVIDGYDSQIPNLANLIYKGQFSTPLDLVNEHEFNAFLFTSRWEGMPNILIEIGSMSIPIISPTVGGVAELIKDTTGYPLPEQPSVNDYEAALKSILSNPVESKKRAACLLEYILRTHSWASYLKELQTIFCLVDNERLPPIYPMPLFNRSDITEGYEPLVSIIIPCYNQSQYLIECVSSILLSCKSSYEIIIIDDGSTSARAKKDFIEIQAFDTNRIKFIRQVNQGLSATRNAGLRYAKGKYIQFLDADDLLMPRKIDLQVTQLEANNSIDVSVCNFYICDADRNVFSNEKAAIAPFDFQIQDFLYTWERGFCIPIHCGLFRAQSLVDKYFDINAHAKEDWLFWTALVLNDTCFGYIPSVMVVYRQHAQSMRRSNLKMGRAWLQAGLKIDALVAKNEPQFFESMVSWFERCYRNTPSYRAEILELNSISEKASLPVPSTSISIADKDETLDAFDALVRNILGLLARITDSNHPPLISVIVPIYNHYDYIERCFMSIAKQQCNPIEIVCVDDASSDPRISRLLSRLANKFNNFKVILLTENVGISRAQNIAVDQANGKYLAFLDCDDMLSPNALLVLQKAIVDNVEIGYFFTDRAEIDECDREIRISKYGGYSNISYKKQELIKVDLLDGMIASHLKVIRRDVYQNVNGCNEEYSGVQDWDLALKISEISKLMYLNEVLYMHRIHSNSVTASDKVSQFRKTNLVRRDFCTRRFNRTQALHSDDSVKLFKLNSQLDILKNLKEAWEANHICSADLTGKFDLSAVNFLREFNSYFDVILWDDPLVPLSLFGYLWSNEILHNESFDDQIF